MCCAGLISRHTRRLNLGRRFALESGATLDEVVVAYRTWGRLSRRRDNAVVVCHALTGSADVERWWGGLLGPGRALDPERDFIICSNTLGSCYGTTGPTSPRPGDGRPYGPDFPSITVRDVVRVQRELVAALGVRRVRLVIGGSFGGMQALEWALMAPERVQAAVAIATSGRHSAWCIGLSEAQRAAIRADVRFCAGRYPPHDPPHLGLAAARMMAMCTYRSPQSFGERFGRHTDERGEFASSSYLRHHGDQLVRRFDANAYITLTEAMDTHDLGRARGGLGRALGAITQPVLVVAISSDVLYPPGEQRELARAIPRARLARLRSPHGHDAFLIETAALDELVRGFCAGLARRRSRLAS